MFSNFFKKRRLHKIMADIERTFLGAFERLKNSAQHSESPRREYEMGATLAALIGSLRDAYPNLPIEDKSIALALIEENAANSIDVSIALADAISQLVLECPNVNGEKVDTTYFMISPENARRAKGFA